MAIQLVDVGNAANDGQGDDLREAFIKVNNSLSFLESISFQEGENLGSAGAQVYKETVDNTLFFRRLVAGENISVSELDNSIVIANTQPESRFVISADQGSMIGGANINYNIVGADAITVVADENTKTITVRGNLSSDPSPRLSNFLNANNQNVTGVNELLVQKVIMNFIGDAPYAERLGRYIEGFDAGPIDIEVNSILDFLIASNPVDFGTIQNPSPINVDLGEGL